MRSAVVFCLLIAGSAEAHDASVPDCGLYVYRAEIVRVIDGDTVVADIDLGFRTWRRGERLRLARIDAPEKTGATREAGLAAAQALENRLNGEDVFICTIQDKQGSFGRYLAEIYVGPDHENINDWMMGAGWAELYRR